MTCMSSSGWRYPSLGEGDRNLERRWSQRLIWRDQMFEVGDKRLQFVLLEEQRGGLIGDMGVVASLY